MDLAVVEQQLKKVQELRLVEHALATLKASTENKAWIYNIAAEDAAESERSVMFTFTTEESWTIFATAMRVLEARQNQLKVDLSIQ